MPPFVASAAPGRAQRHGRCRRWQLVPRWRRLYDPLRLAAMLFHLRQIQAHHIIDVAPEIREVKVTIDHAGGVEEASAVFTPKKSKTTDIAESQSAGESRSTAEGGMLARLAM